MSMTCSLQIVLSVPPKKAKAIRNALEPDNVDLPEDLSIDLQDHKDGLTFHLESKGSLKSLISTTDEILEHVQVALGAIE